MISLLIVLLFPLLLAVASSSFLVQVLPQHDAPITSTSSSSSSSSSSPRRSNHHLPLYDEVGIDYSAANEYVKEHYGIHSYFQQQQKSNNNKAIVEPVYDGRDGVFDDDDRTTGSWKTPTIRYCGFELLSDVPTKVNDWNDVKEQIVPVYLPELSTILRNRIYADRRIRHVVFWNPMLRGRDFSHARPKVNTPTASYAKYPHIDTDIGAYDNAKQLVSLFEKNCVVGSCDNFPTQEIVHDIERGCRFAIVNAWRNVADTPVTKAPLAILSTRYNSFESPSPSTAAAAFPYSKPDNKTSRWYTFSRMKRTELLLFCQYDRDVLNPSDTWHCALTSIVGDGDDDDRQSFDIRCLIVFDEIVPKDRDRFRSNRLRSLLSQQQSSEFCSNQAQQRRMM